MKLTFDQQLLELFGGKITMGIMEAVREQILDEGIEKGRHAEALEIARNLKNMGIAIEDIAKGTGLTIEDIKSL